MVFLSDLYFFSLVSVLSDDFLSKQIGETFASIYLTLALLGIVAFLLILLSMRITYLPLHRLTQKFVPGSDTRQSYLSQLDNAFSQVYQQNRLLNDKLENYRLSIQKSLLNAIVSSKPYDALHPHTLPDIDQFFDTDPDKEIFVVYICGASAQEAAASAQDTCFPLTPILKCFKSTLPEENACVVLETTTNSVVLLLNFTGSKPDKEEVLKRMLIHIYETYGCLSTISDSSCSPMDIPVLYEDAMRAADCWAQIPVVDFGALPPEFLSTTYCYPYEKLNELSDMLSANVFSEARMLTEELLQTVERYILLKNNLQDFFVRCVLIDMLTTIINSMNQSGINFIAYSDLYHELLFLCRSCPYLEKKEEIAFITGKLIDLYEEKVSEKR